MIIDISKLKQGVESSLYIEEKFIASQELLDKAGIISLKDTNVKGYINRDDSFNYYLDLVIEGTMVLPCSITLKPVDYAFNAEISGDYMELMSEIENSVQKVDNSLDIFHIIWENILMEIPIKVTCPDATDLKLSGDGWKLVTEGEEDGTTSAFDKLKDLL
ncbi:MAG: DUF177 domain-containing protein [Bacilli bacterium]|nr:DUF177 domain-containing protein [Bacilli bacterium]